MVDLLGTCLGTGEMTKGGEWKSAYNILVEHKLKNAKVNFTLLIRSLCRCLEKMHSKDEIWESQL